MDVVQNLIVLAHLLGMAAIVGSAVFVARGVATPALLWGARAQLVTGILLVGLAESEDDPLNRTKIGVKLVVAVAVVACAEIAAAKERKGEGSRPSSSTPPGRSPSSTSPSPSSGPAPPDPGPHRPPLPGLRATCARFSHGIRCENRVHVARGRSWGQGGGGACPGCAGPRGRRMPSPPRRAGSARRSPRAATRRPPRRAPRRPATRARPVSRGSARGSAASRTANRRS